MAKFDALNPLHPLTTAYRAQQAAAGTPVAAFTLAALNMLTAGLVYFYRAPTVILLGNGRAKIAAVHLAVAFLAVGLGAAAARTPTLILSWVTLVWCVVETFGLTARLYGHVGAFPMPEFALVCAIQGIRGALAKRRLSKNAP